MRSPGGRELSLSACPGVGNRPPSKKKIANPRGCAREGMVTGRIEPCITVADIRISLLFEENAILLYSVLEQFFRSFEQL